MKITVALALTLAAVSAVGLGIAAVAVFTAAQTVGTLLVIVLLAALRSTKASA
jgi:NAD/NADP transhydrogenase alpha subunit